MEIRNFDYFDNQQVTKGKNAAVKITDQDFDLDLQTRDHAIHNGGSPMVQGSGHFWCHITDGPDCTLGVICAATVSIVACD